VQRHGSFFTGKVFAPGETLEHEEYDIDRNDQA
jgi:hypothetical protein